MDEKQVGQQLLWDEEVPKLRPRFRALRVHPRLGQVDQKGKNQGCKIWRINAKETPGEETAPLLSLSLKAHVNTKPADNKKNGNSCLRGNTEREKTKQRSRQGRIPEPTPPR